AEAARPGSATPREGVQQGRARQRLTRPLTCIHPGCTRGRIGTRDTRSGLDPSPAETTRAGVDAPFGWTVYASGTRPGHRACAEGGSMQQQDAMVCAALDRIVAALEEAREELDELDAVGDDGNHGTHVLAGATAAREAAANAPEGTALAAASDAWAGEVGDANSLWGAMGRAAAEAIPDGPTAM